MLYYLFNYIEKLYDIPGFGVFQFITFRAVLAIIFSLIISLLIGRRVIVFLRNKLIGESIRESGPETHKSKKGTPTMGGVIIIAAIVIPTLLWGDLSNAYVLLILFSTLWMGAIGFVDDYIKVFKKDKQGLKGKFKIIGQVGLGLIVGLTMLFHPHFHGTRGSVNTKGVVRANQILVKSGFQNGDRIVRMGSEAFAPVSPNTKSKAHQVYVVERNVNGNIREVQLTFSESAAPEVAYALFDAADHHFVTKTNIPFVKNQVVNYANIAFWEKVDEGWIGKAFYLLIVIFIVTAVSNGVNITDGLDGLASGTTAIVAVTLAIFSYVSGNIIFANYLNVSYIPMSGELVIFCAAMIGACVGFLWYNTYPAQVFMGDTGSLALGGAVGVLALMVKKELLLPILCGIYFIESLSVIIQVSYFKYTKRKYGEGRRIFRMAPLHHHYELGGVHESKIVIRFWIITILLAVLAFATLKLR
jgi:phospho-N-acetylmuramoyl-pentapeptide-transferase